MTFKQYRAPSASSTTPSREATRKRPADERNIDRDIRSPVKFSTRGSAGCGGTSSLEILELRKMAGEVRRPTASGIPPLPPFLLRAHRMRNRSNIALGLFAPPRYTLALPLCSSRRDRRSGSLTRSSTSQSKDERWARAPFRAPRPYASSRSCQDGVREIECLHLIRHHDRSSFAASKRRSVADVSPAALVSDRTQVQTNARRLNERLLGRAAVAFEHDCREYAAPAA